MLKPAFEWELLTMVSEAAHHRRPIEIVGAGTKRAVGRPTQPPTLISLAAMRGMPLYEPTELVMRARAGTPVADIEAELSRRNQMLAFEPLDLGPLLGLEPRQGTIGGVFATNLSGSRRVSAGGARDHILGMAGVTGRGESFKSGGRVMKNVTGLDVGRALCGSWGTLAIATEITFKVLPQPEATATLAIAGLPDEIAVEVLCAAMGTPYEITAALHLQKPAAMRLWHSGVRGLGDSVTALRLEGFAPSVAARVEKLKTQFKPYGDIHVFDTEPSLAFWTEMRQLTIFYGSSNPLWRISTAPKMGPKVVAGVARYMAVEVCYDWSGGLVWLEVPQSADAGATDIRRIIALYGGHATLIRAEPAVRAAVEVFQPLEPGVEKITAKLKATFDPAGVLNPGRMYANV
jgi:glycolate oxidase FAD binding subunit